MTEPLPAPQRPIRNLRWWIGGALFLVTVINYVDRQTLSANAAILKETYGWTELDYAWVLNAFQLSYTLMQAVVGRLLDIFGTRAGIGCSVLFYSTVGLLTSCAGGFGSFCALRFLLGAGEAANNPGGAKAVAEWFPAKERALAVGLYNSGCAIGGALAPIIAHAVYVQTHSWRPAFLITGCAGFLWLLLWLKLYRHPQEHPRLSPEERAYIQNGQPAPSAATGHVPWRVLLRYRQTWGLILGRFLLDPYWFLLTNWSVLYLSSRGFSMKEYMYGSAVSLFCSAGGNYFAGSLSSYLVHRGWTPGRSRRTILLLFGPSMAVIALAGQVNSFFGVIFIFAYAAFAYTCCGTMFLTLPADVFHSRAVGTVMGLAGTSAGISTMATTLLIGLAAKRYGFEPVLLAAAVFPILAALVFVTFVRRGTAPDPHGVLQDF